MTGRLSEAIVASGNSGAGGQSFLNHVTGATAGDRLTDWQVTGWVLDSGYPVDDIGSPYATGTVFTILSTLTRGARAGNIQKTGGASIDVEGLSLPSGASVTRNSGTSTNDGASPSTKVTVNGGYSSVPTPAGSAWFQGYTSPSDPGGTAAEPVDFKGRLDGNSPSGTQRFGFRLKYTPVDDGGFNPGVYTSYMYAYYNNRADDQDADWEWEWWSDSGYSVTRLSTARIYTVNSNPADSFTFYLRARRVGAGSWTGVGAVSFTDPRPPA